MLFPTVQFALFFLAVLLVAWSLCRLNGVHKLFLLGASYLFYGFWDWGYVPLLAGISLVSGIAAGVATRPRPTEEVLADVELPAPRATS